MNVLGPSGVNQSGWPGQISGVICPRLGDLQIQGVNLTTNLIPVLKDIVNLRAIIGSPLKIFTFYFHGDSDRRQEWQLIGRDKSFMMQEVVPARIFPLDIDLGYSDRL